MTQMRVKRELNVSSKYQFFSSQCFDAYPLKPKLIPDMISVMKIAKTLNLWYYLLGNKRFQSWLFFIKATCTEYSGTTLKKKNSKMSCDICDFLKDALGQCAAVVHFAAMQFLNHHVLQLKVILFGTRIYHFEFFTPLKIKLFKCL